jgi:pilus assembly protein CpaC
MQNLEYTFKRTMGALVAITLLSSTWAAYAQDPNMVSQPRLRVGTTENLTVPVFKSRVVKLDEPAARISVGSPDIADILILRSTQLYVLGKDLGTTNVLLWDRDDMLIGTVSVEVTHDLESLKSKYHQILPDESINVYASQRNIVLTGRVSSVGSMDAAMRMADGYLQQVSTAVDKQEFEQAGGSGGPAGEVINLMQVGGGQQVMLEVKVAEISRSELRSLDAQFNALYKGSRWSLGGTNGGATFPDFVNADGMNVPALDGLNPWGPAVDVFQPSDMTISDKGLFTSFISDDFIFNMALNAAKDKGLAKILAEPTLTTLTGQEAEFLSGGEFPIPVPQGLDNVTIEYKEFGVGVRFLPVVLGPDKINLKINVSVSELSDSNQVLISPDSTLSRFIVPALSKRSAQSTVELKDGQTIAIAGLISENLREMVSKFPGLGDLPIIGYLFRSQNFIKGETELVIMVTPRLAKPMDPEDIRLPTDSFIEPSDTDFYLLGRMEGRPPKSSSQPASDEGGAEGNYGQQVE